MIKFQQNRTKRKLIRILFVTSLDKGRRTDVSVKKIHEGWKLKWKHLFRTFLRGFRWKNELGRLQRKQNKKESETVWRADNLFNLWPSSPSNYKKLTSGFHLRKIWPQFWANRHFPDGDHHYGGLHTKWQTKALPMACNRQSLSWTRILLLLILTQSVTQTDSIEAYTSLGSKLQKQYYFFDIDIVVKN